MKSRWLAISIIAGCGVSAVIGGASRAADDAPATPLLKPIAPGETAKSETTVGETTVGETAGPHITSFAPLAYFNDNCARCHGEYGSFYGEGFAKNLDDAALQSVVAAMANGPAQAPLSPADLEVVTAWHRAFRDGKPFVAIVKSEKTEAKWKLSGEISPGATLQINGTDVKVDGSNWTATVGAEPLKLRACKGEAVTELDASAAAYSD